MDNDQKNRHWLAHPAWAGIAGIVAILALGFAIFTWVVPHPDRLSASSNSNTSSSSIPVLHSSYSGTFTDTTLGKSGQITVSNVSEDTTTGTFTGSGTSEMAGGPTCSFQVRNGLITVDGKMTWILDYGQSNGCPGIANATGQLNDGVITGSWTSTSIQDTGTFTVS